ncbi:FAD-dependent oxidoreductase [Paracoccus sediminicola]|uniref:FAD-dependent oxidoreductase n=1 Tax=Paracoccus sediminicola TaxID=3017783 RepID=UPI0022F02A62|nr:FAD-dependent oxidoreductase [Paracoccus sediminicola]WBU56308.1 FAD-dependent oxidoreductase [Paracoccus sediminicola]
MPIIRADDDTEFDVHMPFLIVGAGACGLVAALAAHEAGLDAAVLERDAVPRGSTAMSSGFIPAAGTRFQAEQGVEDSPEIMASDIQGKNGHEADPDVLAALTRESASVIEWLADIHGVAFSLVTGFLYPGHSRMRMHATPRRTGEELMGYLSAAAEAAAVPVMTRARAEDLYVTADGRIKGVGLTRPDGQREAIGCDALLLACNGFGGNPELVARYIPEMENAPYHGHDGNVGDAVEWGEAIGASLRDLGAYQGHGSLAVPQQTLIAWVVMLRGGIQINAEGRRFSNEHGGYSEQARVVLRQPGQTVWNVYDSRIHGALSEFQDYRDAEAAGAVRIFQTADEMAVALDLPINALKETLSEVSSLSDENATDRFGRAFGRKTKLHPPYYAIRVTGALFHTQGGLEIDPQGRVLRKDGSAFPNLYAAGGAARGVSGSGDSGYSAGNGLLSAVVMGAIAARTAARAVEGGGEG